MAAKQSSGVTLLETIIGVAILAMIAFSVYQGLAVLLDTLNATTVRVAATDLANQELEIVRNMPYGSVGTVGGVPSGPIPQTQIKSKNGIEFTITTAIRNIDDPFDGTLGGNPNDPSPADYKLVELALQCTACGDNSVFNFTGRTAPKGLETASDNGALFVQAIDASGVPVTAAAVQISNSTVSPPVNITDTTGTDGFLRIVDVPPAAQTYRIVVSKSGYSAEQTYASTAGNPNPVKPDLTVARETITQAAFAIDKVSTLNVSSVTHTCAPVPAINFTLSGAKLIGTTPDVVKFSQSYSTDAGGAKTVSGLEWDNYSMSFSNTAQDVAGTIPTLPVALAPDSTQNFKIVTQVKNPSALLVTVKDGASGLPLAGIKVTLTLGAMSTALTTGRGFLSQTDWSEGAGQTLFVNPKKYFAQDGNIDEAGPAGEIKLKQTATSTYAVSGSLESSTFDTGSPSNFYEITWQPRNQPPEAGTDSAKFQIATATTTNPAKWNFFGPDATTVTFYTVANQNINPIHNGDRYIRYKAYLATASSSFTPNVSDVSFTFASDCVPSGQVFFTGLTNNSYSIKLEKVGYQTITETVTVNKDWQEREFLMTP